MKKTLMVIMALFLVLGIAQISYAGLLKPPKAKPGAAPAAPAAPTWAPAKATTSAAPAKAAAVEAVATVPSWVTSAPMAQTEEEKKYDMNSDGELQPSEVRIYLRDVIDNVSSLGEVPADSSILKAYDTNSDGVISKGESEKLLEDVNK